MTKFKIGYSYTTSGVSDWITEADSVEEAKEWAPAEIVAAYLDRDGIVILSAEKTI